jgi:hypothetical protein
MKVIPHQAVSMDLPGGFLAGFREGFQKPPPILSSLKIGSCRSPRLIT